MRVRMMQDGTAISPDVGLTVTGIQKSGGASVTRSPKKPGGAMPMTVKGLA